MYCNHEIIVWMIIINSNVGQFYPIVHRQWMAQHGGVIINIIADMFRGFPLMAHTGAARAAVENLTKV